MRWDRASAAIASVELQDATVDGIDDVASGGRRGRSTTTSALHQRAARAGSRSLYLGVMQHVRAVRQRARPSSARDGHRPHKRLVVAYFPPGSALAEPLQLRARSRTAAPATRGTSSTRSRQGDLLAAAGHPGRVRHDDPLSETAPSAVDPGSGRRRRRRSRRQLVDQPRHPATLVAEPEATYLADVDGGASSTGIHSARARMRAPTRTSARISIRVFAPGARRRSGKPHTTTSARRSRPDGRPTNGRQARARPTQKANDAIRAHVADDPDGAGRRRPRRLPGRRRRAAVRRRSGSSASPTMTPGDRRQLGLADGRRAARAATAPTRRTRRRLSSARQLADGPVRL